MPQLNPSPWFLIFLLSWAILTMIIMVKTMKHQPINNILTKTKTKFPSPWTWPWH
uniref:ATP synthase complex subunit 8 n=1 Tax=Ichthyophis glutinosus TaxID=194415 RepID=Q64JT0_ICHGL|nr:ATP synthase F0 subunit 8 [Ichthyophis glutinosus]AAS13709.1 ATP synthase F0 subunit 8 [Ichthyophis glutinosus]